MANSFVRYTGDGTTTAYSIPFSYRVATDLTVTIAGVATTAFTINAAGTTLTFSSPPAGSAAIEIRRTTSQTSRLTDYESGSILTETDLDTDSVQAFFMSQEAIDDANDVIKISNTNFQWDGQNKRLTNVADPTGAQDLATKSYVDTSATAAAGSAAAAAASATAAATSATNAATSETNAASSASSATSSASTATTKASEASASQTAAASSASTASSGATTATTKASEASVSATAAASSASAASTSETNAASSASTATTKAAAASTSETNAAASATAAAASASAAEGYTDAFDDKYLGSKSSAPTVDNDGDALTDGALYFNTTSNVMFVYDTGSSSWLQSTLSGSDLTATNTVATNIASVNTVATNISDVNSFANIYTISGSAPSSPSAGDLWYDSSSTVLKHYNGSAWVAVTSASTGISDVVDDTTPQLGGDLDANGNDIDMGTNVITDTKVGQWDTAYGYGNHASAGYLVASNNLSEVTASTARTNLGLGTAATTDSTDYIAKTGANASATLPAGTDAQRDGSPSAGLLRFNTTSTSFEGYDGSAWGAIGGGASAGGAIYENVNSIAANFTFATNSNGMSVSPITINSGVTVTVPSGQRWVVL